MYAVDADGQKLDGANRYTLHFAPGQLPPVNAFWSLTMYELPASLLVANPINRYLINSPMLPQFEQRRRRRADTFYIQNESPGKDKEPNWLPAPKGPFVMRCACTGRRRRRWTAHRAATPDPGRSSSAARPSPASRVAA